MSTTIYVNHASSSQIPQLISTLATSLTNEMIAIDSKQEQQQNGILNDVKKSISGNDLQMALIKMIGPLTAVLDSTLTNTTMERNISAGTNTNSVGSAAAGGAGGEQPYIPPFDIDTGFSIFLSIATSLDVLKNIADPLSQALSKCNKRPEIICPCLVHLFQALPDSPVKYNVYQSLLLYTTKNKLVDSIVTFDNTPEQVRFWCESWCGKDLNKLRDLFLRIAQALDSSSNQHHLQQSQSFLLAYLNTFVMSNNKNEIPSIDVIRQVALNAIRSPTTLASFQLLTFPPMKTLEQKDATLYQLLQIVCGDSIEDFTKFTQTNGQFFQTTKLDVNTVLDEMRLLALGSLGAKESNSLTYAQVATKLDLKKSDFETWMVNAIGRGVVEAKIDQLNETIVINKVSYHVFKDEDWINISSQLKKWRASVRKVAQTVTTPNSTSAMGMGMGSTGGSGGSGMVGGGNNNNSNVVVG
jgi:translation initiation factor 3 subunit M